MPPTVTRVFPDIQRVLVEELAVWVGEQHVDTQTPEDLQDLLPFIRVIRVGGGRDRLNDRAAVDLDVFASTYTAGALLAEQVAQWLCGPPPPIPVLDRVECAVGPRELPWGDVRVRRLNATYQITARRIPA